MMWKKTNARCINENKAAVYLRNGKSLAARLHWCLEISFACVRGSCAYDVTHGMSWCLFIGTRE